MTEKIDVGGRILHAGTPIVLPDLLRTTAGERVDSAHKWEQNRRGEILELFREHVYGRIPTTPYSLSFEVLRQDDQALNGKVVRKEVAITIQSAKGEQTFRVLLYLPSAARTRRVPVFLLQNSGGNDIMDRGVQSEQDFWVKSALLEQGMGMVTALKDDVAPDKRDHPRDGIYKLLDPDGKPKPDVGGAIAAWAWGLSRIMDYLETDAQIDARRVALFGLSRLGKAALWAGAQDRRFAIVISCCSGAGGAKLARRQPGESLASINKTFPHWFCENYKAYGNREQDLPVDQHMLLAMIAPRPVYVSSASQDEWADPLGEFLSCVHATPAYELYGLLGNNGTANHRLVATGNPHHSRNVRAE
jgi:hypothetical protein